MRAPDGTVATPENTEVAATLKDQLFSDVVIWRGGWLDGVRRGDDGTATVVVPRRVVDTLRRGAYLLGILVGDKQPDGERVASSPVYLEVDYTPGGATSTIPYHE